MFPDFAAGFPANVVMINNTGVGGQGNKIFHSFKLDGRRSRGGPETGALAVYKGLNYWVNRLEITDFLDDAITVGFTQPGFADYVTVSNCKIHSTGKALTGFYQNQISQGEGHVTAFFNELNGAERNPMNRGAEHFHFFNNWVHGWRFSANHSGGLGLTQFKSSAGNRTVDSNMLSQSNVYETSNTQFTCAEQADPCLLYTSDAADE